MAQLALGLAGAGISTALGAGPAPGWIVGTLVGGLLFGPDDPGSEPQIGDNAVTSSAYGTAIPICYGRVRLAGNIIWAKPIEVVDNGDGGSKLSPSSQGDIQSALATFAVAFAEGPAATLLRIWADGNLIYDANGFIRESGLDFRFYAGTEDQEPDPTIEEEEGVGTVPGFRGMVYIVFLGLPLAPYGNRIPSISADILYQSAIGTEVVNMQPLVDPPFTDGDVDSQRIAMHWDLMQATVTTGVNVTRRVDLTTMLEVNQVELPLDMDDAPIVGAGSAPIFYTNELPATDTRPIHKISNGVLAGSFGSSGASLDNSATSFVDMVQGAIITSSTKYGARSFLVSVGAANQVGILLDPVTYVFGAGQELPGASGLLSAGGSSWIDSYAWWLNDELRLYRIMASVAATGNATVAIAFHHDFSDLSGEPSGCWYDETDGGVIVMTTNGEMAKVLPGDVRAWTRAGELAGEPQPFTHLLSKVSNGRLAMVDSGQIIKIDTTTGEATNLGSAPGTITGFSTYHGPSNSLFVFADNKFQRWALERPVAVDIAASSVVADLLSRSGVTSYDADEFVDDLVGYAVTRPTTARAALDPLLRVFSVEAVQSGNTLRFLPRGQGTHLGTVYESDMVAAASEDGPLTESRREQTELPRSMEVTYIDPDRAFQQSTQRAQKPLDPLSVVSAGDGVALQVPIAIRANQARTAAEKILYAAWEERVSLSFALARNWLRAEPTDQIDVVTDDGRTIPARILKTSIDPYTYSVAVEAVAQEPAIFTDPSDSDGDSGTGPDPEQPYSPATDLILEELPLLRDLDDVGRIAAKSYFQLSGYGQPWFGGRLYRSLDAGLSFGLVGSSYQEATHGFAENALGSTSLPFTLDTTNQVTISLRRGQAPASVTYEQMMAGANLCMVGRELLQFQTVDDLGNGRFVLSNLRRGRRGTEVHVGSHAAGDVFAMLMPGQVPSFLSPLGYVGANQIYRPVGLGQAILEAPSETRLLEGADLKPYAPAALQYERDVNDLTFSWIRRTRVGGAWMNGTGTVSLAEDYERYDLLVYDNTDTLVREELALLSPDFYYSGAEITADFGGYPSSMTVVVYQLSAQVGRGWPATLDITL